MKSNTELVDLHHSSESDQTNEGVLGYHGQRHDKVVLETLQLILVHASINNKQKNRSRNGPLLGKSVLNCREVRDQLTRTMLFSRTCVRLWKGIAVETEVTCPDLGCIVDLKLNTRQYNFDFGMRLT